MFKEKPDFSTSDLHELHDRKLRNQLMIQWVAKDCIAKS